MDKRFQFQYGAIRLGRDFELKIQVHIFQFQYGAIRLKAQHVDNWNHSHFNSSMVQLG